MPTSRTWSLLAALPILLVAGCAGPMGPDESTADESEAITENANDKIAFDFFLGKGLTAVQSAGIIGNLDQESGMDPTISQYGGGPGRGIAQWSAGGRWDTSTNANVVWYSGVKGESRYSLNLQLEFIWWELTTEGYGYSQLKAATTVTAAVNAFQDYYEICGACDSSNRIAHGNAALAQFGSDVVGPTYAAHYVSQSWPLASAAPIQLTQYQKKTGSIDLKNTGNVTWKKGVVKLAPIPRDHASAFAADTWLSTTRVSTLAADVPAGGTGHFEWDLYPTQAGDFKPYFGLVAEGVTWFADSGGPGDDVMQVNVHVAAAAPPTTAATTTTTTTTGAGGAGAGGAGAGGAGGGEAGGPPATTGEGGAGGADDTSSTHASSGHTTGAGETTGGHHPSNDGDLDGNDVPNADDAGGCSMAPSGAPMSSGLGLGLGLVAAALVTARRRRA